MIVDTGPDVERSCTIDCLDGRRGDDNECKA